MTDANSKPSSELLNQLDMQSMSEAEETGLDWILSHGIELNEVTRKNESQAIDFIVNDVLGVEVKSTSSYTLSSNQLSYMSNLVEVMVIVVPDSNSVSDVWIEDIIQGVHFSKKSELTGAEVSDGSEYSDDEVTMRAQMDEEDFHRFKRFKHKHGLDTNAEAIVHLMDLFEEVV